MDDAQRPDGLPAEVSAYRRTPVFDAATIPAGLLRDHATKAGVWGVIRVLSGRLSYVSGDPPSAVELGPGRPGLVRPEARHSVAPLGDVRFFVEFYR